MLWGVNPSTFWLKRSVSTGLIAVDPVPAFEAIQRPHCLKHPRTEKLRNVFIRAPSSC